MIKSSPVKHSSDDNVITVDFRAKKQTIPPQVQTYINADKEIVSLLNYLLNKGLSPEELCSLLIGNTSKLLHYSKQNQEHLNKFKEFLKTKI